MLSVRKHGTVPGQRVAVVNRKGGNWADYAVVPADALLPVSDDLPDKQVASFLINQPSAILMLRFSRSLGEWLLQSAAGSEIGRMIIKLAKTRWYLRHKCGPATRIGR
jgi:NADPH:quinone reductase-like Zn-dependent oxidoreductase